MAGVLGSATTGALGALGGAGEGSGSSAVSASAMAASSEVAGGGSGIAERTGGGSSSYQQQGSIVLGGDRERQGERGERECDDKERMKGSKKRPWEDAAEDTGMGSLEDVSFFL